MKLVSDPPIKVKIDKMKQRVRWQDALIKEKSIDQTRLFIDDGNSDNPEFSFLTIGDSGYSQHYDHHPQRQIAQMMLEQEETNFILHTGDVVYQVGSKEYYHDNFIEPYREYLVGGKYPELINYDDLVFNLPFLPTLGNHDYYDLPVLAGFLSQATWGLRRLLPLNLELDVGWHGSFQGEAYSKAFLDYLLEIRSENALAQHLDQHYTHQINNTRCLSYQPEKFTRLPNRYYHFTYGGIDFFALDSNTFNAPSPLPDTAQGDEMRQQLVIRQQKLEQRKQKLWEEIQKLIWNNNTENELTDDKKVKIEQIEEELRDIEKRLDQDQITTDVEQLDWLKDRLIASWQNPEIRGRVVYFHHPPYVTEQSKWKQGQTLAVRQRLRHVFDRVAQVVGEQIPAKKGIVNLVLSGHAHCLEHLYTEDTGHADSFINWVVCGGSGHSLRRQRVEGDILTETDEQGNDRQVAKSLTFIGRNGHGASKRKPYSFLKVEVRSGNSVEFVLHYYIAERFQGKWHTRKLDPVIIN